MSRRIILPESAFIDKYTIIIESCEDIGLAHAWKFCEDSTCTLICPPSCSPPKRRCLNCGKEQAYKVIQNEIKEWVDIEHEENKS